VVRRRSQCLSSVHHSVVCVFLVCVGMEDSYDGVRCLAGSTERTEQLSSPARRKHVASVGIWMSWRADGYIAPLVRAADRSVTVSHLYLPAHLKT
jgi:hypothetical protein